MRNVWATHLKASSFQVQKQAGNVRIMQFNCKGFPNVDYRYPQNLPLRKKLVVFLTKYQPDIITLQDFNEEKIQSTYSNITFLTDTLGYKYRTFRTHYYASKPWGKTWGGIAIFSKYPIQDTGYIPYAGKQNPETILWANIIVGNKVLKVATTHFQSMHLSRPKDALPLEPNQWEDSSIIYYASKLGKLRYFQTYHAGQAKELRTFLDAYKNEPLVVGADLNSVPSSYVYNTVKGSLHDAFLENGWAFGRSFHSRQPALRIDYLFHNNFIEIKQMHIARVLFSDHDPLIMDVRLK